MTDTVAALGHCRSSGAMRGQFSDLCRRSQRALGVRSRSRADGALAKQWGARHLDACRRSLRATADGASDELYSSLVTLLGPHHLTYDGCADLPFPLNRHLRRTVPCALGRHPELFRSPKACQRWVGRACGLGDLCWCTCPCRRPSAATVKWDEAHSLIFCRVCATVPWRRS